LHRCAGNQIFGERIHDCSRDPFDPALLRQHPVLRRLPWATRDAVLLPLIVRGTACVHLPASTLYGYIEYTHEMSRVNEDTDALSIGPSAGYFLFFVFVHALLLFTTYTISYTHMHIHVFTYITLFFWIKLKLKMCKFLTIQKSDIRHFSVSGFAVVLKRIEPFDGTFYKR
jgi:hypothetical protein